MTELKTETYVWEITDPVTIKRIHSKPSQSTESPIFKQHGFNWYLEFYKNWKKKGIVVIFLELADLSPHISGVSLRFKLGAKELGVSDGGTKQFSVDHMAFGWHPNIFFTKDVKTFKKLTIECTTTLLNVYDKNGKAITNQYQQHNDNPQISNDKYQLLEVRLNSLTNQMDLMMKTMKEIQKTNNDDKKMNDNVQQQIDELKKTVAALTNNDNDNAMNNDKQIFKDWVHKTLKLPQYYDAFVKNGIETLDVVELLTMDQLSSIGIKLLGHQIFIMNEINKLKQKPNNMIANQNEGNFLVDTNQ